MYIHIHVKTLRNTVGAIPMKWYEEYDHIGFDHEGNKIERSASKKTVLDRILAMKDDPAFLKTIYDELHDQERPLTNEELDMALRIRAGRFALASVPMYQDMIEFVPTQDMPLRNAPILKSQFLPSKWEAKKVAQMVRNLRAGKLKPLSEKEKEMDESREGALPSPYPIWDMDDSNTKPHYHVPPPKLQLPSHAESYNPPPEYILTPEEEKEWEQKDPLHRIPFLPHKFCIFPTVSSFVMFPFFLPPLSFYFLIFPSSFILVVFISSLFLFFSSLIYNSQFYFVVVNSKS